MTIDVQTEGHTLLVYISGKLNALTAPDFEKTLKKQVELGHSNLILDFSGVKYISSAGLRAVLVITKMLKARGGGLILAALSPEVKSVFEISGFTSIIPVVSNIEEAKDKL